MLKNKEIQEWNWYLFEISQMNIKSKFILLINLLQQLQIYIKTM